MSPARPATLGATLNLESVEHVDAALHELGFIRRQEAIIKGRSQTAIDKLTAANAERLRFEIDGQAVTFSGRAEDLEAAIADWCAKYLPDHLEGESKSLRLTHGTVGSKKLPDCVACEDKKVLAAVEKKAGLKGLIAALLQTALGAITLGGLIRIKTEVDKTAIKRVWDQGGHAQRTLKALGVTVETDRKAWVIEPNDYEVTAPVA